MILRHVFFFGIKFFQEEKEISVEEKITFENEDTTTNVIKDVSYRSKDIKGNVYILNASEGRIDLTNSKIIFLTDVEAKIILITIGTQIILLSGALSIL